MSDSDESISSYYSALDGYEKEEEEGLFATFVEDNKEITGNSQEVLNVTHTEATERYFRMTKKFLKSSKTYVLTKAKNNPRFLQRRQYQRRFRQDTIKQYLVNHYIKKSQFLTPADWFQFLRGVILLEEAGVSCKSQDENAIISGDECSKFEMDPWQGEVTSSPLRDGENFFSFEDSFIGEYNKTSNEVDVEKTECNRFETVVTMQPRSTSSSMEQFEDKTNLLEDAIEASSLCSWIRGKWDKIKKSVCFICICPE